MHRFLALLLFSCLLLALSACQPSAAPPWTVGDLRTLDPLDAPAPSVEILAVYTRTQGSDLEIRLDLLDVPLTPDYDLTLRLITPTGEIFVLLPANGRPVITPAGSGLRARLVRDPWLDTVTVRLNRLYIPQPFSLQAAAFLSGQTTPVDETALVRSDALPPLQRAPVVLAFWDVFPACTPAQALRRWDGAHTGPNGGRHGLKLVLDSVEEYSIPVALLDLKTPASLAALDLTAALPRVQRLSTAGLLILPEVAYSTPADEALAFSRDAAQGFGLMGSQFVYTPGAGLQQDYPFQFLALPDAAHLARLGGTRFIPLTSVGAPQAAADGPSLEVRRFLMEAALSPDGTDIVALGGSLPGSTWGDVDMAGPTFAWLAGHPWVWVLDAYDLMSFPTGGEVGLPASVQSEPDPWLEALHGAPNNEITRLAWQTYLMLHTPTGDPALQSLRDAYAGQVGILLAAAEWAGTPYSLSDCSPDLDLDGRAECVLANSSYFSVIETDGARLSHLFFLDETGAHQLVAPTSQFIIGLGDPSQWHPERGDAADPGAVMGAFSDTAGTFDGYRASVSSGGLTLLGTQGVKVFRLAETGLEVTYQDAGPVTLRLPLAVDPQAFYTGPSNYQAVLAPGLWTWGPGRGVLAEVRTDAELSAQGFTVSQVFLGLPENPNQDYPAGHYFPFPFSLVTVRGEGEFTVWIRGK